MSCCFLIMVNRSPSISTRPQRKSAPTFPHSLAQYRATHSLLNARWLRERFLSRDTARIAAGHSILVRIVAHRTIEARRAYAATWRARNREKVRAGHAEYMRIWRGTKAGRAAAERRPRKTARRVAFWNLHC